ncbi:family 43 glycosylhydrolase [Sphingomonas endophytica]|uniref:Beta-xylosidase n=1 Tax=Sphingomonas endophytica TaxID=869719 RepID=A0A147HWG6_9SPHN|nr:family 43 glycosylhydrolase [Sphingomonas endophytica]KTT69279.1 beta-xylosidase [Sphingomonas endophytica]
MRGSIWAAAMLGAATMAAPAWAGPATVNNGSQFTTTTGGQIDAHGGGVIKVGNYYYFLGENRNPDYSFRAVSMYRSTDLKTWEFRNDILKQSSAEELNFVNIERPKVLYNAKTKKFVLWAHKENGRDYVEARVAVATSDTVDGNYTYLGSFNPLGYESRDMTVFQDTDGSAYLISAAAVNYDLNIYKLSDDYTKIDKLVTVLQGHHREAPAIVKRGGTYFLLTSGASGWNPNTAAYFTAASLAGPWSGPHWFGHNYTYNSQSTFILPVQGSMGTSYLYMGDRWGPASGQIVNDSTYVWLPLRFPTPTSLDMPFASQITIDAARGTIALGSPETQLVRAKVAHSNLCLNINGYGETYGAKAIQWTCNREGNEMIERRKVGNYTQLVFQHSGLCLAQDNDNAYGTLTVQTSCSIGPRSQWTISGDRIVNRQSGSCLAVGAASQDLAKDVIVWPCTGDAEQKWTFE